jgi:phospholipid transport system substrate-binding protein
MYSAVPKIEVNDSEVSMIPKKTVYIWILFVLLTVPMTVFAMEPMEIIQGPIDEVVEILNDPKYVGKGNESAQREEIWETVKPMFNFEEISKRAVARKWRDFSDDEKAEFTDVFSQFLGNTYIDKIQGEYHNEKIVYLEQNFHSDAYAEVKTKLLRENIEIPVNYRMIKKGGEPWRVYDIIVEGVSLVKNYRVQFTNILKKESPAQLIERLNKKLVEQNKELAGNG